MGVPRPPAGAGPVGRRLWAAVLRDFELNGAELTVLRQAVRAADRCEALAAELAATGLATVTAHGTPKLNPLAAELRSSELALCRLLLCLRIPLGGVEDDQEPAGGGGQYRGMRGVYALHGGAA